MPNYPEIDCPRAYELYHDKGVMFRAKSGSQIKTWKGKFVVALNSKWMRIDVVTEATPTSGTVERLPLTQQILESINPAPKEVLESCENRIAFVIPQVLTAPHP